MTFLPFLEAKEYVRSLGFNSQEEWRRWCKEGNRPDDIPYHPDRTYKNEWRGMGDWLGTGRISNRNKEYWLYPKAKEFVQSLSLKNIQEWRKYCASGKKKPVDIPSNPDSVYKREWKGWGDWLGTNYIAHQNRKYTSFKEARKFVQLLGLNNRESWLAYVKTGKKPSNIPADPSKKYKREWKGWGDWLGTGTVAPENRQFRPFNKAKRFVNTLGIGSWSEWIKYCRKGNKPEDIPTNPDKYYGKEWKGWGDWLGTGRIADQEKVFRSFKEARKYIHSIGLKSQSEWNSYSKSGRKPQDIPSWPPNIYLNEWKGWGDWLGTGTIALFNRVYRPFKSKD